MIEIGIDNMIVVEVIIEIILEPISYFRIIEKNLISRIHTGRLKIIIFYSRTKNRRITQLLKGSRKKINRSVIFCNSLWQIIYNNKSTLISKIKCIFKLINIVKNIHLAAIFTYL